MNRRVLAAALPQSWWDRLKGAQYGFIVGIIIGLLFGWFFHGVISMAVRFGMLLLLLLPLIVIGWLWFRSQRATVVVRQQAVVPARTDEWQTVIDVPSQPSSREPEPSFVDVPLVRPRAQSRPDDIEAELEALKRQRERDR
jgi:predicted lipid-binding transport protein (Tim44 family)